MTCPKCGSDKTAVFDSRPSGGSTRRRRRCLRRKCAQRFTTYEVIGDDLSVLVGVRVTMRGGRIAVQSEAIEGSGA